ncbi:TlpA family protein disulfide reductase [Dyadobacter pollutisoli]|uniref:TlpA disulfide reductase family protein n=1 Tax=Dyadobacter pollutisoli TaxID=2910158 RepID=A0A9E8NB82_9BACT|nr:TlpA disulfide reductase family protein [Dyadobacter pollutisoli]WAC13450.1 TlpA disulfide reductase family protein [Dyadobacter pollutisoli]
MKNKNWLSASNIFSAALIVFTIVMVISPQVKGWTIQSLMKIGLFQPRIDKMQEIQSETLPNMSFKNKDGKTVDLASLKGKVVFINFWATWCAPCIAEMPSINALQDRFGDNDDIVFLMVDVDGNDEKSAKFMKEHQFDLNVFKAASAIAPVFMQGTIPTTVILDRKGKMVFRQEGAADYNSRELVDLLVGLIR